MFWRAKISFYSDIPVVLPIDYNHFLQSYIYHTFTPEIASFLHNKGFKVDGKVFKLFTFSKLFGRYKVSGKVISFISPFYFYFSTPLSIVMDSYVSENLKKEKVRIGDNEVRTVSVDFEEIKPMSYVVVKTLSPITAYITEGDKNVYFSPYEGKFFEIIKNNLRRKYEAFFGEPCEDFMVMPFGRRWDKVITKFKNTIIVGWEGRLIIEGDVKLVSLALSAGVGSKNSQGFGMVIEDKRLMEKLKHNDK